MYAISTAPLATTPLTKFRYSAEQFDVPVPFLLKQAAWLYEKQLVDVRAQMRRIGNSRPASIVGEHQLSLANQAQSKFGSLSGNNTSQGASTSGSGSGSGASMTVRGTGSGQGRGSFRDVAFNLSQVRNALNVAGSPIDRAATQSSSAVATPRPAFLQLEPPVRSFQARPPPSDSTTSESAVSDNDENDSEDDEDGDVDNDDDADQSRHRTLRRSSLFRPTRILSPSERSGGSSPRFLPFLAGGDTSEKSGDTADEDYDDEGSPSRRQDQYTAERQEASHPSDLGHTLRGTRRHQQSGNATRESRTTPADVLATSPRTASSISDSDGKQRL